MLCEQSRERHEHAPATSAILPSYPWSALPYRISTVFTQSKMIEDDGYRASSQYRLWSFTEEQLHDQRTETNRIASEKVRRAFNRAQLVASNGIGEDGTSHPDINTLTVDEEQRIVQWGCEKILEMKTILEPSPPSQVIATAIQYLRRFYLYNSPMTYHPKSIMVSALWMATKADHFFYKLDKYCHQLGVTEDDVKAPEFLIMQALRFTLEVRHPTRSLEGGIAEIRLHSSNLKCFKDVATGQVRKRIDTAGDKARRLLVADTQMTDAYFLYTPAQMWLAAVLTVDEQLAISYIEYLFDRLGTAVAPIKQKLRDTITECAKLIKSYKSPDNDKATKAELGRIGKKLRKCQDPEKLDIVEVARAKAAEKREGTDSDAEKANKKRKLERERLEKDGEVFGPDLKNVKSG